MLTAGQIKDKGRSLGFDVVGVSPIGPFPESAFYSEWLDKGYGADMHYLEKQETAKMTPDSILPGARSVIVCAMNYNVAQPRTSHDRMRAWISRYAWGEDYHESIKEKIRELASWIEEQSPQKTKAYVDTGPLLERVYAKYAGIGWFGKNTCIINNKAGSWLFLGCILTDLDLATDSPAPDRCGTCTRCIDACPTHAIVEPYVLDSRKCIAYTTIELRGEMPESDREGVGHHLFGCDICQDVCPWNRKSPYSENSAFQPKPGLFWPEIDRLLDLSDDEWRQMVRGTSMKRAKIKGLLRNLMVVAANSRVKALLPKLERFFTHEDEHVRSHARWASRKLSELDAGNCNGHEKSN